MVKSGLLFLSRAPPTWSVGLGVGLDLFIEDGNGNQWIKFVKSDPKVGFYWHFHSEFLINQWSNTTTIHTLFIDSATYSTYGSPGTVHYYQPNQITSNSTIISGNFGLGFTLYVAPFAKDPNSHFFFQTTVGASINSPNFTTLTTLETKAGGNLVNLPNYDGTFNAPVTYNHPKAFYLVRSSFLQNLSNKSELIIGMTVRGLMPSQTPQCAAYLGLNLDFSILSDLFSK